MKTNAKLFPVAPAFDPQLPDTFRALTSSAVEAVPVFWPSRSKDFLQSSASPCARRSAEGGSIYAVDDNEGLIELYTILLEARGYIVRAFNDRAEAVAALEKDSNGPELLIMDYLGHSMPVDRFMHRSLAAHPTRRILMASGLSSAHVRFSSARPDRFIQKPFTAEEFLKEVKAALVTRCFFAFTNLNAAQKRFIMRTIIHFTWRLAFTLLLPTALMASAMAQGVAIPDPGLNAAIREALQKPIGPLTEQDLLSLTNLNARDRNVRSIDGLEAARNLVSLDLQINRLTNFSLPSALTKLITLDVSINPLTNFFLPAGLTNLTSLTLESAGLTNLTLPAGLTRLNSLALSGNQFTSLNLPPNLTRLSALHLRANRFTIFILPAELTGLTHLDISKNPLTNITLPAGLNRLTTLRLSENRLTSLILPTGMTNLVGLHLTENQLTNLVLPSDLYRLESLNLGGNQLTSLSLPSGLTNLAGLFVVGNQLTTLTLPPDMTQLIGFGFLANPLVTFVLPEPLAASNLAGDVALLQDQGVSVFIYPLTIRVISPRMTADGVFEFGLTGPPGIYAVFVSTNLASWSELGAVTNTLGTAHIADVEASLSPAKFYRAHQ